MFNQFNRHLFWLKYFEAGGHGMWLEGKTLKCNRKSRFSDIFMEKFLQGNDFDKNNYILQI